MHFFNLLEHSREWCRVSDPLVSVLLDELKVLKKTQRGQEEDCIMGKNDNCEIKSLGNNGHLQQKGRNTLDCRAVQLSTGV